MRTSGAAQLLIAVGLLVLALSPLAMTPPQQTAVPNEAVDGPRFAPTGEPYNESSSPSFTGPSSVSDRRIVPRVNPRVRVVAEVESDAEISEELQRKYSEVNLSGGARRLTGTVSLSEVREFSATPGVNAVHITGAPDIEDRYVADGVDTTGVSALQERGLTGHNVTIGVIDSGFAVSHPSIADHVGAYQTFSSSGERTHGTAVASVLADTAPEADLHLAAVGSRTTASEYREAVDWLRESGADVIVDAGSYLGQPGDGNGTISRIAADAADDVAFVTSAGNYANRHWMGIDRPGNESQWVTFEDGNVANRLANGRQVSGRVTLGLNWNGSADYDLYLYRETSSGQFVWTSSRTDGQSENISTVVTPGQYHVEIRYNHTGSNATGPQRLSLFSSEELTYRTASSSVTAPATAPGVIAVGAVNGTTVEAFSSRGPTVDGRRGVDLVAPDDARITGVEVGKGTSFAAPYVAGTIAVLKGEYPGVSTANISDAVFETANDLGPDGVDTASGYGRLDAVAAAERLRKLVLEGYDPGAWVVPSTK